MTNREQLEEDLSYLEWLINDYWVDYYKDVDLGKEIMSEQEAMEQLKSFQKAAREIKRELNGEKEEIILEELVNNFWENLEKSNNFISFEFHKQEYEALKGELEKIKEIKI